MIHFIQTNDLEYDDDGDVDDGDGDDGDDGDDDALSLQLQQQ